MSFAAGMAASEAAAGRWTDDQKADIQGALLLLAHRHPKFTTDELWKLLGPDFPVTKGIASQLLVAQRKGWIKATGTFVITHRDGEHDHAQRLQVWESLVYREVA